MEQKIKKVIAINASPRVGWNTSQLVEEAAKGVESTGINVEVINLYKLEKYTGCISCFACKVPAREGVCAYNDGLTETLDKIRQANGLIIGSPNYLGEFSAGFRALFERMVFQYITYRKERYDCNNHRVPVLLITTSNEAESKYEKDGFNTMLSGYKIKFTQFIGPTEIMICGDTLQVKDYSRFNWTSYDPVLKKKQHDEEFPKMLKKAFSKGQEMAGNIAK